MSNEQADVEAINNEEELDLDLETQPEEKPKETPEAKLARIEREAKQLRKRLNVEDKLESKSKTGELGYAELGYLVAKKIEEDDEIELVKSHMAGTGKSLKDVLSSKYFQAELKEIREAKASTEAIPSGTKRSGQGSRNSVDYWVAKGENPPNTPENRELRVKVVEARIKAQAEANPFTPGGKLIIQ